jgi:hypothetical protein
MAHAGGGRLLLAESEERLQGLADLLDFLFILLGEDDTPAGLSEVARSPDNRPITSF